MKRIHWGWKIVISYVVFITGTVSWVGYAITREVDLVRPDYYEHGLQQDQTMAARGRAHALSALASIRVDRALDAFVIQIPKEQAVSATGTITLYRPNASREDQTLPLALSNDGTMIIHAANMSRGVWRITADWSFANKTYQLLDVDTL